MLSIRSKMLQFPGPTSCTRSFPHQALQYSPGFEDLVQDLNAILRPCSGLDASEIDHKQLEQRLQAYKSNPSEWNRYAFADFSRNYTRNLVDKGNGKFNLLILVWNPGKGSPIHDHTGAHCVMKILSGTLKESLYDWPENGMSSSEALRLRKETFLRKDDAAYMSDKLGLHKMENPDPQRPAVSLHLYTPPWAEQRGSHLFNERTGKATHALSGIYSEYGRLVQ